VITHNTSGSTYEQARHLGADYIIPKYQEDYNAKMVVDFVRSLKYTINRKKQRFTASPTSAEYKEDKAARIAYRMSIELNLIGINPKVIGRTYIIEGVSLIYNGEDKNICDVIGRKHAKTETSVMRAIQDAINRAWKKSSVDALEKNYTARIHSERGVPSVTEFLYFYANKMKNWI
jgi:hypothetical protein